MIATISSAAFTITLALMPIAGYIGFRRVTPRAKNSSSTSGPPGC